MIEKLIRQELPLQQIHERNSWLTVTVPIHKKILELPESVRVDTSILSDAMEGVKQTYNTDMEYHLSRLDGYPQARESIRGYETFNKDWILEATQSAAGFLNLFCRLNDGVIRVHYISTPVILFNKHGADGQFDSPERMRAQGYVETLSRSVQDPDVVFMQPQKMDEYSLNGAHVKIDLKKGMAATMCKAFCSEHVPNMGQGLLLRSFAVFYLNKLLEKATTLQ